MDNNPLAIQEKKSNKPKHRQNPQKPKKKQQEKPTTAATSSAGVKVVYISSPVNFNTSASEFRSLVQQLTGRDSSSSENSNDADNLSGIIVGGRQHQESVVFESTRAYINDEKEPEIAVQHQESAEKCDQNSDLLDAYNHQPNHNVNYNMPDQMLDNFSPSNYWYDQF